MAFLTSILGGRTRGGLSPAEMSRDVGGWLGESGGGSYGTSSGQTVTPESMLSLSAVYAAARAISEDVACMPLKAYRRLDGGGKEEASGDAKWQSDYLDAPVNLYTLVHHRANPDMINMSLRSLLVWWASLYGTGYAEIKRDGEGKPVGLNPLHPHKIKARRDDVLGIMYEVRDPSGQLDTRYVFSADMVKIIGPSEDGIIGNITAEYGAESFGIYMAAEQHTGSFFGRGATLAGVITFDQDFKTTEARRSYIDAFNRTYGGAANAGQWMLADNGAKVNPFSVDPEKSQLIETIQFRIEDVARWFRVPPVIIGHNTSTPYANIAPLGQFYHIFGLKPWAIRIEQELDRKLGGSSDGIYFEHVVDSLIWANPKERAEVHAIKIRTGQLSPNEARAIENKNPYEGGGMYRVEQNLAVIDKDGNPVGANQPAASATPPRVGQSVEAIKAAMMPTMADAADRIVGREVNALANKKEPDEAWKDKFYKGHRAAIVTMLEGPSLTLAKLTGKSGDVGVALGKYADAHVAESRRRLSEMEDPAVWKINRVAWIAEHLTEVVCDG